MRYPASEKLEIIRIVEQSHLPARRTLEQLGIPRRTFCRWYDRYFNGGPEALTDRPSAPCRVWNRIPTDIRDQIIELALEQSELSPRELAVRFTDEKRYFVSEATVYRLLKAHDLITSPAFVVIKAADRFHTQTTRPNEMWQTDFTYFKIIGWGWMYLSTVLDDFSRYIIAWKLCSTMRAEDVTDTLELALAASGCDQALRSVGSQEECVRQCPLPMRRKRNQVCTIGTVAVEKEHNMLRFDFVFVCVDKGSARRTIAQGLHRLDVPFIDTGIGLGLEEDSLDGCARVTLIPPGMDWAAVERLLPFGDDEADEDLYNKGIQTADLNSLNATLAVLRWKRWTGFYRDERGEVNASYMVEGNLLTNRKR